MKRWGCLAVVLLGGLVGCECSPPMVSSDAGASDAPRIDAQWQGASTYAYCISQCREMGARCVLLPISTPTSPVGICSPPCESDVDCPAIELGTVSCQPAGAARERLCLIRCTGDRDCFLNQRCMPFEGMTYCL